MKAKTIEIILKGDAFEFQSPWIRFALIKPLEGGESEVSIPVDKVRAKRIDFSDDGVTLVSIPVDKVRARRIPICREGA